MLAAASSALLFSCGPGTPDLDSLRAFYESETHEASTCLRYASRVGEAYDLIAGGTAAELIPARLLENHRAQVKTQRGEEEFMRVATAATGIAAAFHPLEKQATLIAYMQICRSQVIGRPFDADPRRVRDAQRCVGRFPLGDKRQDCVARVFNLEKPIWPPLE